MKNRLKHKLEIQTNQILTSENVVCILSLYNKFLNSCNVSLKSHKVGMKTGKTNRSASINCPLTWQAGNLQLQRF